MCFESLICVLFCYNNLCDIHWAILAHYSLLFYFVQQLGIRQNWSHRVLSIRVRKWKSEAFK